MTHTEDIRVLCISLRTPPEVRPQAILIGKMIPEWIRQGISPVVVTYPNGGVWDVGTPIYTIPEPPSVPLLFRIPFFRRLRDAWFYERSFRIIAGLIKKHRINLVYSFAKPVESNVIAMILRKRLGVKAIAHYSDPHFETLYGGTRSPAARHEALEEERGVMKYCDRIVFIDKALKRLVMRKFPSPWMSKARIVTHCYEPSDYPADTIPDPTKFTVSHVGVFRKDRDPGPLFRAARALLDRRPELEQKLVMNLVGSLNTYSEYTEGGLRDLVHQHRLDGIVRLLPTVSYLESLATMKRSDVLVAIDLDIPDCPYILSKVFDYAGSGRPMLGIMQEDNPTAVFIRKAGYRTFRHQQTDGLSKCLEDMIDGKLKFSPEVAFTEQFDVRHTTAKLIDIFAETLDSPS